MRRTGPSALALLLLGAPPALVAQTSEPRAHASFEASLIETTVLESAATFAGAAGLMSLDGRFAFGAGAVLMLGSSTAEGDGTGSDLDLRLAYGGLLLQMTLAGSAERYLGLRTMIGAGNAKLDRLDVGSEVAADNFGVLEPEVVGAISVAGPLHVGLGAGYRHVFGVDDLPNVVPGDLRGFSARVRLSIRTN
jgi:hypothetical protein